MLQHNSLNANHFPSFLHFSVISLHFIFECSTTLFIFPLIFSFHNLKLRRWLSGKIWRAAVRLLENGLDWREIKNWLAAVVQSSATQTCPLPLPDPQPFDTRGWSLGRACYHSRAMNYARSSSDTKPRWHFFFFYTWPTLQSSFFLSEQACPNKFMSTSNYAAVQVTEDWHQHQQQQFCLFLLLRF